MKIDMICNDIDLVNKIKEIKDFDVNIIDKNKINESVADVLIISNKEIDLNNLISNKNTDLTTFYMIDDTVKKEEINRNKKFLELKKITIIPPKHTIEQIKEKIFLNLYSVEKQTNVFSFFGADSKVGTTSICQLVGESLAKRHKEKNIIILSLNGQDNLDYVNNTKDMGLNDIKPRLKNNYLTLNELKECCYNNKNLFMLNGDKSITENYIYEKEEIYNLVDFCKNNFDFVLIDAGNVNNIIYAPTIVALTGTENLFLVAEQTQKALHLFKTANKQIFDILQIEFTSIILNKYSRVKSLKKEEIIDNYNLHIITTLPNVTYDTVSVNENIALLTDDKSYNTEILHIIRYIEKICNLEVVGNEKKNKKSIINIFGLGK